MSSEHRTPPPSAADRSTFDLRREPWIAVRTLDGARQEVSLRDVFRRSVELQGLVGDVPTQEPALLRLLLAVLHRAVPWDGADLRGHWARMFAGEEDFTDHVDAYLDRLGERFDLLHPQLPFLQVGDLRTRTDGYAALTTLIADVPNNAQYFTVRAGRGIDSVSLAEAARWLVHTHAYDVSGIKSGAVGDDRVKGGKGYPIGTGWVGQLGVVVAEGRTLRETLLLNLVLQDRDKRPWPVGDRPVWERPALGAGPEGEGGRLPVGPADLFTFPSRRIRLQVRDARAVGVLVTNGDALGPQNRFRTETMTGWRRSAAQEKLRKEPLVYMPRTHAVGRAFWRGLEATLAQVDTPAAYSSAAAELSPAVLSWLSALRSDEHLPAGYEIRTRALGVAYGSQNSVIDEILSDSLVMHAVLLGHQGREFRATAISAVQAADAAVRDLANLAGNLAAAAGGDEPGPRERAAEIGFFELDAPFRVWLQGITAATDVYDAQEAWQTQVHRIVRRLGDDHVEQAGTPAWVGREVTGRLGQTRWIDAAVASGWFHTALHKSLPRAAGGQRDRPATSLLVDTSNTTLPTNGEQP